MTDTPPMDLAELERLASGLPVPESDEGYLTDEWLEALSDHEFNLGMAARFLAIDLPIVTKYLSCAHVNIRDGMDYGDSIKIVEFVTGGWSGAEALIGTMLEHYWIRHLHREWQSGGFYKFTVKPDLLKEEFAKLPTMKVISAAKENERLRKRLREIDGMFVTWNGQSGLNCNLTINDVRSAVRVALEETRDA